MVSLGVGCRFGAGAVFGAVGAGFAGCVALFGGGGVAAGFAAGAIFTVGGGVAGAVGWICRICAVLSGLPPLL